MTQDVLQRFRDGVSAGHFTLSQVAEASRINLTTLSYMKNNSWGDGVLEKLEKLEAGLNQLDPPSARSRSKKRKEAGATA
jgi:hypothetical protein